MAEQGWLFMTTGRRLTRKMTDASNRWSEHRSSRSTPSGDQHQASPSFFSHLGMFVRIGASAYVLQMYGANCTLVCYVSGSFLLRAQMSE